MRTMRLPLASIILLLTTLSLRAETPVFKHHFITTDIPGPDFGYGCPALADFDGDGDLDFACSVGKEKLYWFENQGPDQWVRHTVGDMPAIQLGAVPFDVDGDGLIDIVIGGVWYRNPGKPRQLPFERFVYDPKIAREIHEMVIADIDGDGRADIVALGDHEGCFWYSIPAGAAGGPAARGPWVRHPITDEVLFNRVAIHAGFSPHGVGDLNGDGAPDIVLPGRWLENRDKGAQWISHPHPFAKKGPWGISTRSWICDMNRDGKPDIVITDCDQKESRAAWLENNGANPPNFTIHLLPLTAPGKRGSFHSLAVVDFDRDGDLDIVTADQEDPSIFPQGATPRWYLWENLDGKGQQFKEHVILDARLGGHDIIVADLNGDGKPDLVSKIWRLWSANANAGRFHADWMENLTPTPQR